MEVTGSNQLLSFPELTQESCDVIIMVVLKKESVKDIQLVKHLSKLKKLFKLTLLRGQDKNTHIRACANSLLSNGYVDLEGNNFKNLKRDEVKLIKEVNLDAV